MVSYMMESIDAQAARAGTLRYRRLLALAALMSGVTTLATIAALSVNWYAYERTFYGQEIKNDSMLYTLNRTVTFWGLQQFTYSVQLPTQSWTTPYGYDQTSKTAAILHVAQGFDLIAVFTNGALFIFLMLCFSKPVRTKLGMLLGARLMRVVPSVLVFAVGVCLLISALGFVGINRALDSDGVSCGCYDSFATKRKTLFGQTAFENPYSHTIEQVLLYQQDDWGPQAGWFLTLLQLPFIFVLLYSVAFNRAPLPIDHQYLAEVL